MELFKIFLAAVFVKNIVFIRFLALCSFIGMTSDVKKSTGMGWAVLFVTVIATAATYPLYKLVLAPYHLGFLQTLLFILVIASLVQLVEFYLKKSAPALYSAMGVYLPLITTNCAILAVTLDVIAADYTFIQYTQSVSQSAICWRWFCLPVCASVSTLPRYLSTSKVLLSCLSLPPCYRWHSAVLQA